MPAAPIPDDEVVRLHSLACLDVLDSPGEAEFDALVQSAALVCGAPISMLSLIDADRQWFKAVTGLPPQIRQTPREQAFCAHAMLQGDLFEVHDATRDPRFADNPLVLGVPHIRFYAGAPLRLSDGSQIGTLCVIDRQPRQLDERQRELLGQLAVAAVKALEGRRALRERTQMLHELAQNEQRLRRLYESTPTMLQSIDPQGRLLTVSDRWLATLGYTRDEVLGQHILKFVAEASREHEQQVALPRLFASEHPEERDLQMLTRSGDIVDVRLSAILERDACGQALRSVAVLEDVTERLRAERSLREERYRLASIIEGTGAGTWELNVQTGQVRCNEAWAAMLGHTLQDLMPLSLQSWADRLHPDDLAHTKDVLAAHLNEQKPYEYEARLRHRDGHWVWMLVRGRVLSWTSDGRPEWMFGTHADLTARKQQEEALKKSESFLHRTGDIAGVGGWEMDLDAHRLYWSPQLRRMLGLAPEYQPHYEESLSLYAPQAQPAVQAAAQRAIEEGLDWDLELPVIRPDGGRLWVRMVGQAEFEGGRAVRLLGAVQDITERVEQRKLLERANERIALATDSGAIGIWEYDSTRSQMSMDAWGCRAYGLQGDGMVMSLEEWIGRVHPDDRNATMLDAQQALRGSQPLDTEFRVVWPDGSVHHLRATARRDVDHDTGAMRLVGANWDVTALRELGAQLAEQHELLRVTLESIGDAVLTTDAVGQVTWLNPLAERLTGWPTAEARGRALPQVFQIVDEHTREPTENPLAACLREGKAVRLAHHALLISRDGQEYGIENSAAPIRGGTGTLFGAVLVFHDVTEQRRLAGEMSYRAKHDALTGLVNRTEFETRLCRLLEQAHQDGSQHALMFIDLDQFKIVNDACGHSVGDQLLQQVSKLLSDAVRSRDTLARLGGDEFAVILEHCNIEQAQFVAQKICDRADDFRFVHEARRFRIGTSIGLVPIDSRWATPAAAMQAADTSCYAAKEAGRNQVHTWFDTDLAMRARNGETNWATRIEQALDDGRFVLFAQRIEAVDAAASAHAGGLHAEVLLRMVDTDGSLIAPGAFLPAAERFHLASHIDRWVLRHACDWLLAQPDLAPIETLCINLSGKSIGDRAFHRHALEILTGAGAAVCTRICLEITETAAVTNLTDAAVFIGQVRQLGVRIALDDFGAGASSFGYLKTLPVDMLKIDGQFIKNLLDDPLDDAAVRCFVDVARVMGLKTVAEFVDRPELLVRLRELGVDFAQGFLLHRPEPIDRLLGARGEAVPSRRLANA